ncbi:hypothetical protein REPUB_Repub13aG0123500 [Reevesia pubescens]
MVQVLAKDSQILTVLITGATGIKWGLSAIYVSPMPVNRTCLWNYLKRFDVFDNMPWMLIGDFNQICSNSEKQGGLPESKNNMAAFLEVFSVRNLVDLGAQGPKFTWSNEHKDGSLILKRLDRALCNLEWRHFFPDAMVRNLPRIKKSDHCPVLLQISKCGFRNAICRPFRFEAAWLTHDSFASFIEERWRKDESLHENLKAFMPAIKEWNTSVFGNIFTRKKKLLARLEGVQRNLEIRPNKFLYKLENELLVEYNEVLMQEELLWFQKLRSQWVQFGDRNTKFFHTTTVIRRNRNRIMTLKREDESWCDDQEELKDMVLQFFRQVYTKDGDCSSVELLCPRSHFPLAEDQLLSLIHVPHDVEVHRALMSMAPFKSPGPDDLQWPSNMVQLILFAIRDFLRYKVYKAPVGHLHLRQIAWDPPSPDCVKLNVDGALSSNRVMSIGGICRDDQGACLFGFNKRLGIGSAFQAKLQAIQLGEANTCADFLAKSASSEVCYQFSAPVGRLLDLIKDDAFGVCRPRAFSMLM